MRWLGWIPILCAGVSASPIDFQRDVRPIFASRCAGCHGAAQQASGLRLDAKQGAMAGGYSGPVIVPGNSAASKLILRVTGAQGLMAMPPAGPRLSAAQIATLRTWIDEGANWPDGGVLEAKAAKPGHWAFQPVRMPSEPALRDASWPRNAIDRFILARLDKEKIAPSPEAEKRTLLRRLSLDLTGIPPTPEEIADFLADRRDDAYERAVDRLLASPHYGERWARPWLDRARYADTDGYEKDWGRPYAWRYRQWVIDALNRDMPFDRFTIEQMAGDELPGATIEQKVATGFHRNTMTNREGGIDNNQFQFENTIDRVNTVGAAWLGLTVGCAQCHDHKFDPISQRDYYSLYSFFENVDEADIDAPMPGEMGPYLAKRDEYRAKRAALLAEYKVAELQAPWEKRMLEAEANPGKWTDWDLAWDCLLKLTEFGDGREIIHIPPEQRTGRQRDILVDHFIRNYHFAAGGKVYDQVKFKELDRKLRELKDSYPQLTQAMVVADGKPVPGHVRLRGDYRAFGVEVQPAVPVWLPALDAKRGRATRLDLARWLVNPENPLTARVTVNWIWQELFGRGLVTTPEDFGTRAEPPSHPELLDWLAARFMEDGWSTKGLIRTIVLSATYRQSSKSRPELETVDPVNVLLARQSRVRLSSELVRDSALSAAGLLSPQVGGKSVYPPQPAGVTELGYGKTSANSSWPESKGEDRYRRGLYIWFQRSTPYPMLMNFDSPKASVAVCRRDRSNTALQALNLLNDPVFLEAAQSLAYTVLGESGFEARLNAAALRVLGREPNPREMARFRKYFEQQKSRFESDAAAAKDLAPAEMPGATRAETAALVATSTVLLNLDEFITRE